MTTTDKRSTLPLADFNRPFVAVDWGTTSFRLWHLNEQGEVVGRTAGPFGMAGLQKSDYAGVLDEHMDQLNIPVETPVVICGMAGAAQGWHEAPYMSTCEDVFSLGHHGVRVPAENRNITILPGIKQSDPANVMRGEETQILGLLATEPDFQGTVCLPGTHTKWVRISGGRIEGFTTCMSGELFALLSEQSVLRHSIASSGWDDAAFNAALQDIGAAPASLAVSLFGLRASTLLDNLSHTKARSRLSGLLIGLELAATREFWQAADVVLVGEPSLGQLYASALAHHHISAQTFDAEALTLRGLTQAYIHIEKITHVT